MAVEEISFEEALRRSSGTERDLLLGNGFSMAAHEGFDYRQLLERASVTNEVRAISASARTSNFEAVMRILLAEAQGQNPTEAKETRRKIEELKRALVVCIHEVHPPRRTVIEAARWSHCEGFLEHFISKKKAGRVFTTNYDLLLSWAVAPDRDRTKPAKRLKAYEGFRGGAYDGCGSATIIYLHGALHLYGDGADERQLQYRTTGVALHDQIATQLADGRFPIIITEGASSLKKHTSSKFLKDALSAFRGTCRSATKKVLFTVGHSLGPEDAHILEWIPNGTIGTVFLGAYDRGEADAFQQIAAGWMAARPSNGNHPLKVSIFNTAGIVWGPKAVAA